MKWCKKSTKPKHRWKRSLKPKNRTDFQLKPRTPGHFQNRKSAKNALKSWKNEKPRQKGRKPQNRNQVHYNVEEKLRDEPLVRTDGQVMIKYLLGNTEISPMVAKYLNKTLKLRDLLKSLSYWCDTQGQKVVTLIFLGGNMKLRILYIMFVCICCHRICLVLYYI